MFKECLDVFELKLQKEGENIILDEYIPADGSYLIVKKDGSVKCLDIKMDKKKRKIDKSDGDFLKICFYDYHSKLISMNKRIDPKKLIHSNNYLSFFVKKDSIKNKKLTNEIIDKYYDILKNPLEEKYMKNKKTKTSSQIYRNFEQKNGCIDLIQLEANRKWIKEHIFIIDKLFVEIDMTRKDYLKIFFEEDEQIYEKENNRYILPNIYNKNEYNVNIEGDIYGIPDNNITMNDNKPFLFIKTRKNSAGYLLDNKRVLLQKQFFDYLLNQASIGKYNVYVDIKNNEINCYSDKEERKNSETIQSGYYLRIKKGKEELEIQSQDNIVDYKNKLNTYLEFKDIAGIRFNNVNGYDKNYTEYSSETRVGIGRAINDILFSKSLLNNYFVDVNDISINDSVLKRSIITYRNLIFDWVYKGIDNNFAEAVDKFSIDLIKNSVLNDNKIRGALQLNLRWSLQEYFNQNKGGEKMADIVADLRKNMKEKILNKNEVIMPANDREYYYGIGQLMAYFISLSKASKKTQSMINPVINAKVDRIIKDRLLQLYKKYNYDMLTNNYRVKNLYAMILGYKPEGKIDQEMILFGYMDNNLIYTKEEK